MADCVFEELSEQLEVVEREKKKEDKRDIPSAHTLERALDFNQLLIAGIVTSIVILSIAVLIYAARH